MIEFLNIFIAEPPKASGWKLGKNVTPDSIKKVLHDHVVMQSIMIDLVGDLREALATKQPAKFVPALQKAIKNFAEALPKLKFNPLIKMDKGISKEVQDLAKKLSASPSSGTSEVDAFVKKQSEFIKQLFESHKFMKENFGN